MKRILYWYELLPEKIRDKAQAYHLDKWVDDKGYSEYKGDSLEEAILTGFVWADTDEGWNYWSSVLGKYGHLK